MFSHQLTVRLADTDAAGRLYFAHQLRMAHEAYESFMAAGGFRLGPMLKDSPWLFPIVRAEADYLQPIEVGDQLEIAVTVAGIGTTSFTLGYTFFRGTEPTGTARTVHVALARATGKPVPLPLEFRAWMELNI